MPTLLLSTYHGSKIVQFEGGSSFLLKIHIIIYCQYVEFRNALDAFEFTPKFPQNKAKGS